MSQTQYVYVKTEDQVAQVLPDTGVRMLTREHLQIPYLCMKDLTGLS